jgi:hypothetical protein
MQFSYIIIRKNNNGGVTMGIEDFYDYFKNKSIEEIIIYMLSKNWSVSIESTPSSTTITLTKDYYITYKETIKKVNNLKETLVSLCSNTLYTELKNIF